MALNAVNNHNELKRKERQRVTEVIEISSDSEPENWPAKVRHPTPPRAWPPNHIPETKSGRTV